jgi:hypothetical protein
MSSTHLTQGHTPARRVGVANQLEERNEVSEAFGFELSAFGFECPASREFPSAIPNTVKPWRNGPERPHVVQLRARPELLADFHVKSAEPDMVNSRNSSGSPTPASASNTATSASLGSFPWQATTR